MAGIDELNPLPPIRPVPVDNESRERRRPRRRSKPEDDVVNEPDRDGKEDGRIDEYA